MAATGVPADSGSLGEVAAERAEIREQVRGVVRGFLRELRSRADPRRLEGLPGLLASGEHVDYSMYADEFALHYLWPNARKVEVAIDQSSSYGRSLIDLGSGAGSATLGALLAAPHPALVPDRAVLVDRSERQLELAVGLLARVRSRLGFGPSVVAVAKDLSNFDLGAYLPGSDLMLASHVFGENTDDAGDLSLRFAAALARNARLLVIEQTDDPYWTWALSDARFATAGMVDTSASTPVSTFADRDLIASPKHRWSTRWLLLQSAPKPWMADLVRGYFRAWVERDPDQVAALFTEDALYVEKPFSGTLHGRIAIRRYWHEKVEGAQTDVRAAPLRVTYGANSAWISWRASFLRLGESVEVAGMMVVDFDHRRGKIARLGEVFRTQESSVVADALAP